MIDEIDRYKYRKRERFSDNALSDILMKNTFVLYFQK